MTETFCVKCRKRTENKNEHLVKTANNRNMVKCTCAKCGSKKSQFVSANATKVGNGVRKIRGGSLLSQMFGG